MPATSEPASGSVMASAPIFSPLMPGTSQRCFCSSVPNFQIGGVAMFTCPPMAAPTPPDPQRASSSAHTASCRYVPPCPPYFSSYFRPRKPSWPHRRKVSCGTHWASSHSMTCGRSSVSTKRRSVCRSSSCSPSKGGVAAACVVEAKEVSAPVLLVRVVVRAYFADLAVLESEPLRAAVEPPLSRLRIGPHHRPLDHGFIAVVDPVLEDPLCVKVVDTQLGVLGDLASVMRAQARVVVGRVVGEVGRDLVGVAAAQCVVVALDVPQQLRGHTSARLPRA